MFDGIKNNFKETKKTTKKASTTIFGIIKEIPKLPWKKLPLIGWLYLLIGIVSFIIIIFVLMPLIG